jgi:hypothetical protein
MAWHGFALEGKRTYTKAKRLLHYSISLLLDCLYFRVCDWQEGSGLTNAAVFWNHHSILGFGQTIGAHILQV